MLRRSLLAAVVFATVTGCGAAARAGEPEVAGETYVPVHSSVMAGDGRTRIDLAVTLSIHNVSESKTVEVRRIDYYDGAGRRIESRLAAPTRLAPFATLEIFIPKSDVRGGTGANFVVGWAGEGAIAEPVIEAVMIGDFANQSYSFVSTGRRIELVRP